jgi:hypothetical protein
VSLSEFSRLAPLYVLQLSHWFVSFTSSALQPCASLQLVARARQFSSFIVLAGRIAGANLFEPKYACIIKDKVRLKQMYSRDFVIDCFVCSFLCL